MVWYVENLHCLWSSTHKATDHIFSKYVKQCTVIFWRLEACTHPSLHFESASLAYRNTIKIDKHKLARTQTFVESESTRASIAPQLRAAIHVYPRVILWNSIALFTEFHSVMSSNSCILFHKISVVSLIDDLASSHANLFGHSGSGRSNLVFVISMWHSQNFDKIVHLTQHIQPHN